jgi:hypothetical protein
MPDDSVSKETMLVAMMLDRDEDHKGDILDRFDLRGIPDEESRASLAAEIAFVLEDELRADIRFHFIDCSMWSDIIYPVIDNTDFVKIAETWLEKIANMQEGNK